MGYLKRHVKDWRPYFLKEPVDAAAQRNLPGYEELPETEGQSAVLRSRALFEGLLERAKTVELKSKLKGLNEDVLGAYFFRRGEIQLYWMALGLFAGIIGRPVRELALITLLHELAHAHTHLGLDIDLQEWKTNEFAGADMRMVEGLAQFYTEAAMDRVSSRSGELSTTFNALLGFQSEPYLCHRKWGECSGSGGEIVRLGMVAARRHGIQKYDEFKRGLNNASGLLERSTEA